MTLLPLHNREYEMPAPAGHLIGFTKSHSDCVDVFRALSAAGFPESGIMVLCGNDGIHLLKRMMSGSRWGEAAEDVLQQGVIELGLGACAMIIEVQDHDNALIAANVSTSRGGYGFTHFGLLVDERLTP